jgi:hypothetical protein
MDVFLSHELPHHTMKAKHISASTIFVFFLYLTGCSVHIVNLTPPKFPASPTGTYTLQALVDVSQKTVIPDSFEALIVIDGEHYSMSKQSSNNYLFEYDYQPPPKKSIVRFYYVLNYLVKNRNKAPVLKQIISDLHQTQLTQSTTLRLDKQRAAVDTKVTLYGSQFIQQDRVLIDGTPCETTFISSKKLQFLVPEIKPSFGYIVEVFTPRGMLKAGTLRVDAANPLRVLPKELELKLGQPKALAFMLNYPAPYGGLYIDVTTDIPDSIIMPKVLIPERARTVSITLEGKHISNGNLFINAGTLPEIVLPVTVR